MQEWPSVGIIVCRGLSGRTPERSEILQEKELSGILNLCWHREYRRGIKRVDSCPCLRRGDVPAQE